MAKFKDINARAYFSDYVKHDQPHTLVDVRTPVEYAQGHLPGAVNIPLNTIGKRAGEISADKPVIVVCASGNRSRTGADKLMKAGLTDVYNLQGGTLGWMREGLEIER